MCCFNKKKLHLKFFFAAAAVGTLRPFFFVKLFAQITTAVTGAAGVVAVYAKLLCNIGLVYVERSYHQPVAEGGSHQADKQYKNTGKLHAATKVAYNKLGRANSGNFLYNIYQATAPVQECCYVCNH